MSARGGLYEFWTVDEVPVRLHDCAFEGLAYQPAPEPALTLRFRYDDPARTPAGAAATPVISIAYRGVRVQLWEEDPEAFTSPVHAWTQVSAFDFDGQDLFVLDTYTLRLAFTADVVDVRLLPAR